jgi:SP family sugar:H+ symporter-like MFS transporter
VREHKTGRVLRVAGSAALGGFLLGYDTGVVNGAVVGIRRELGISPSLLGIVVSVALLGGAIGAWFAGPLADRLGRVRMMQLAAVLFALSTVGAALSAGPVTLTACRLGAGLALGAATVIAAAYIAEISPAELRGRMGSLLQLGIVIGIFVALLADFLLSAPVGGPGGREPWGGTAWRWMFAAAVAPALGYGGLALRLPESPRYLAKTRRLTEAREVLRRLLDGNIEGRMNEIMRSLAGGTHGVRLAELRGPRLGLLPVVWVGILLSLFQQLVGINAIFYYSTVLWRSVGFSEQDAMLSSMITSVVNIAGTLVAISLIDRIGRRPLLLIGAAGMVVTLAALTICFGTASTGPDGPQLGPVAGKTALLAANLYVAAFGMSWGPAIWVLLGEMFNNRIRATALAVATAAQWLANWLVSTTFPVLASARLSLAYGIYTAFAVLAFAFVLRAVRETKGRELEEM